MITKFYLYKGVTIAISVGHDIYTVNVHYSEENDK